MKSWNITVASESKQRSLMKADLEDETECTFHLEDETESVPFTFNIKGRHKLRPAPLAYVPKLNHIIVHLLEEKDR